MEEQATEKFVSAGKVKIRESVNKDVLRLAKAAGKSKVAWCEWAIEKMAERVKTLKQQVDDIDQEERLMLDDILKNPLSGGLPGDDPGPDGEPGVDGARFTFHLFSGGSVTSAADTLEEALEELGLKTGEYLSYEEAKN